MIAVVAGVVTSALVLSAAGPSVRRSPAPPPARRPASTAPVLDALDRLLPDRRRRRRDRQLPDALDRLGSSLRAGASIGPALVRLADEVAEPLGSELGGVARSVEHGAPVAAALGTWSSSPRASRDVSLVAAALTIGAGSGGEVARAVDGVAATLRERHEVEAEARALATQARASATVLAVAPVAFAALVATIEPGATAFLVTTPVGAVCLALGIGLDAIGVVWMARITGRVG